MRTCHVLVAALSLAITGASAIAYADDAEEKRIPLREELSRSELGRRALEKELKDLDILPAAPKVHFRFPADAGDGIYGIDVSHHNEGGNKGPIEWRKLTDQGMLFVYAKATQGTRFFDPRFERTWKELGELKNEGRELYRGAYHFMEAIADPEKQAKNFLVSLRQLGATDLPPCLDLEDDYGPVSPNNQRVDRWKSFPESLKVEKIKKFLAVIEAETGRKPLIYTRKSWWVEHLPTTREFENYQIWISDYGPRIFNSNKPVNELQPRVMERHKWTFWQFSETGKATNGGMGGQADANLFNGTLEDFRKLFAPPPPPPPPVEPPPPPPVEPPPPPPPVEPPPPPVEPPPPPPVEPPPPPPVEPPPPPLEPPPPPPVEPPPPPPPDEEEPPPPPTPPDDPKPPPVEPPPEDPE